MPFGINDQVVSAPTGFGAGDAVFGATPATPRQANGISQAVIAGLQSSATGLAFRGKLPDKELSPDAPWYERAAAGAAGVVADLPLSVIAAIPATPTGPIGMGAAAFAAPMALRDGLITAYNQNHASSWEGVWEIAKSAAGGGIKGGIIGAATMGAGRVVGNAVLGAGVTRSMSAEVAAAAVARNTMPATATALGAELTTLTTTAAALEGRLPTAQEFLDNAVLLGGMKGAVAIAKGMRNIYAETGKTPAEVVADAARDPSIALDMKPVEAKAAGGIDLYHGSPHKFDAMDVARIGSGEGSQTFGKGLYLAESQDVAGAYRDSLSPKSDGGYLYKVQIPKAVAEGMLDLDVPFGKQPPAVQAALNPFMTPLIRAYKSGSMYDTFTAITKDYGDQAAAALQKAGVQGVKYFDQFSREKAAGTRNYVVFDANNIRVIERNGEQIGGGVPRAYEPLALEQRIQAAYNADSRPADILKSLTESPLGKTPVSIGAGAERKPLTDPVRIEYVTDQATHQGLIRLIADAVKPEIEAQRRGKVSNEQTMAEMKDLLGAGKLLPREIGSADNAAQLAGRLAVLRSADADVIAQAEAYRNTPMADRTPAMDLKLYAAIERQAALQAEAQGALAEWGRAGQIVRQISRDPSMLDTGKDLMALVKRKGNFQDIADIIVSLKDPAQRAAFAREAVKATTTEKAIEAWKAGILSGPLTHLANLMGNATKWAVDLPESILSATITANRRAAKGDPLTMAQYKARALSPLIGVQLGAKDALIVAGEVLRHDTKVLDKADVYRTAIEGKTGEVVRTPFRLLQAQDALFRIPAERAKAYELAVDRAVKEGLHPDTAEGRQAISGYMTHPTLGLSAKDAVKAMETIDTAGSEAVFAQRLGPRLETAQRAMAGHWSQLIVPFIRTPANLVSWAVQHVPGLNLMSARWRDAFAAGGEQRDKAISRVVIGTGLAMTAFTMAQDGVMTGGGLFDKEQGNTKRAAGWQAYSVKIGDTYYSYQRMEPVAKVLGIAADLVEMMEATKDDEDKAKMASMLVMMFGNATISTTYLSGLANAVQSITDPVRYGDNFMEQYATSLVPKIVGQTVTLTDPYKREVDGVMEAIQSQLPYFREKLMPKRDVWGEPSKNDRWFAVMPVVTSEVSKEKVKTEAVRLSLALNDAPKFVLERGPFKPGEKKIELTSEQRDIYRQVSGGKAMEILAPIVNSPDWDRIPDFAKAKIYQSVVKGARAQGEYSALPPDAASRDEMRRKIIDKIVEQTEQTKAPEKRVKASQ